jgi:hypothetical protein
MKIQFKKYLIMITAVSILSLTGCTTTAIQYDYGDYSEKYYSFKKEPGAESLIEWKKSMMEIVTIANEKTLRVPPGIYANLGYLSLKENNMIEAVSYFELEKKTYPQATVFMNRLIQKSRKTNDGEKS